MVDQPNPDQRRAGAAKYHQAALDHIGEERWDEALAALQRAVAAVGDRADFYTALGDVQSVRKAYPEAAAAYERALELQPGAAHTIHKLGFCRLMAGDRQAAVAQFRRALELDGTVAAFHESLGDTLSVLGDDAGALASFEQAASLAPPGPALALKIARLALRRGDFTRARAGAEAALKLAPGDRDARRIHAEALMRLGESAKARAAYDALAAEAPLAPADAFNREYCILQEQTGTARSTGESALRTPARAPYHFVWISLEQGMQPRSGYFQYALDRTIGKKEMKSAVQNWTGATTEGPGNFHLPDHLDPHLTDFISFENMYTPGTSTVVSVMGGFTGIPHACHALVHVRKTDPVSAKVNRFDTIFDALGERGYKKSGFHIFKSAGPGFILPDYGQGMTPEIEAWPSPFPSHVNYVAPVARLDNHLSDRPEGPHAICLHLFAQALPAVLEVLADHGINRDNTVFVIAGDHGHPNWDFYGAEWMTVHDIECDEMNTHVYCRFSYPGCEPRKVDTICTTLDFFPTVMDLLDIPVNDVPGIGPLRGIDLLPLLEGGEGPSDRVIRQSNRYHFQLKSRVISLRDKTWRYEYMHYKNVFLHPYHRINGVKPMLPEMLYRSIGNGYESVVNIDNPRFGDLVARFRRLRVMFDTIIQRFWLENLRSEIDVPDHITRILDEIDPLSNDLERQIELSESFDAHLAGCIEQHLKRPIDMIGEIKRMVPAEFYYSEVVPNLDETVRGRVAIWDLGDHYAEYVRPILNRINASYFIDESGRYEGSVVDGLPVYGPDALGRIPVETVLICSPPADYDATIRRIRAMKIDHQPFVG